MNFLAHLHLAPPQPLWWVGSLWPDMVKGKPPADLPAEVLRGIALHRFVDRFTDTHPLVFQSRARLFPNQGRYTAILIDVFYDHLLASDWAQWSDQSLAIYLAEVYTGFRQHEAIMPPAMQSVINRLIEQDWIALYATLEGMQDVLAMLSARFTRRFARPVDLTHSIDDLRTHLPGLRNDFNAFYPLLQEGCAKEIETADERR